MVESDRPDETPTVLVIEDDKAMADTYEIWLDSEYDVRTTYSGADGLARYDPSIDIVLLDRRLPDISGTAVVRSMAQRDVDDQKALLTSVDPGQELTELPCDEYLSKPITKSGLRDAIRELQIRSELDEELQRHFTLTSKIAALQNSEAGDADEALVALKQRVMRTRARIEDRLSELDDTGEAYKILD